MKFGNSNSVSFNPNSSQNNVQANQNSSTNTSRRDDLKVLRVSEDERDACMIGGLVGSFTPVENDFTARHNLEDVNLGGRNCRARQHFRNEPTWNRHKREKVKRFRFIICFLGLCAAALALMSRALLNVAIVDMVKRDLPAGSDVNETSTIRPENYEMKTESHLAAAVDDIILPPSNVEPKFNWSVLQQNILLGSFHTGYIPSMLVGGGIADKYGAKYPLFACVFGSFIINFLTPHLARYSIYLLIGSRFVLGTLHGGLIPAIYELFNKWLTLSETSIFVPLVKVSLSAGIFMGSFLPGAMASFGFGWPYIFYLGSCICLVWSISWLLLATSTPQTSPLVKPNELHRIMRKKTVVPLKVVPSIIVTDPIKLETSVNGIAQGGSKANKGSSGEKVSDSIPWTLIITNPSVLALTFVKFTYNLGLEFWGVEGAVYLRNIHDASTTTISAIASGASLLLMALITPVGWAARIAVERRILGFSRTSWRKIFQGTSNFSMAAIYLLFPLFGQDLLPAGALIVMINFFWMFGAGGESMMPYDLSTRFPATIMGFAHAISVFSGVVIPSVCSLVLGDTGDEPGRWNLLFLMLAGALCAGGLVFCLIIKAEPFLPGEKQPKIVDKSSKK